MSWDEPSGSSDLPPIPENVFVTRDCVALLYQFFHLKERVPFLTLTEEFVRREKRSLVYATIRRAYEAYLSGESANEIEVPEDAEAALMGWRVFKVMGNKLYPYSARTPWSWGLNTAHCTVSALHTVGNPQEHLALPVSGCTCGFWAYRSYELMQRHGPMSDVTALVAIGGDIVEAEWGVRGSHARVVAFLKDERYAQVAPTLEEHKPEHIPALPMAECEMLAFDMGLDWKLPPPPPVPEVAQYVGLRKLKDPEPWEEAFYYPRARKGWIPYLLFSKPEDLGEHTNAYYGPIKRIDNHISSTNEMTVMVYVEDNERMNIDLRRSRVRYQHHECEVWTLSSGNLERDKALAEAQVKYGTEWLRRYER